MIPSRDENETQTTTTPLIMNVMPVVWGYTYKLTWVICPGF